MATLQCQRCGTGLRYAGRGRYPKWCEVCATVVEREQNLARHDAKRQWERDHAGNCGDCGARLSNPRANRCAGCDQAARETEGRERTERFIELRQQGLLNHEIAECEGVTAVAVATAFTRAHRYGLTVPPSPYHPTAVREAVV